ncbi:hypothetical protein CANCADRAFT_31916 [Tortispora caseinolytica NRRL Y-17796]|uniref:acetyl-CoA C-acyltransferase n=1 Tax=Tortispora caseinolytica NRRL Y-17796 TaxID=767744 RepID=A0A1E4THP9_9ASCO|nr:hypothetical protein CANCADRAFT_31916 [Tortispora caseinolytica NRRL Y-17796]
MDRLQSISNQIQANPTSAKERLFEKSPDDVVFVAAYRSAFTKGRKGAFKDTDAADLLQQLLKTLVERTKIDPSIIGDIVVGNVSNVGSGATEFRAAALAAGIPYTVPLMSVNRQCSSGLMSVIQIAREIQTGQIDVGIAAGAESMSKSWGKPTTPFSKELISNPEAQKCTIPMGITSENVAAKYHISRADQDAFAASSYQKAEKAQKAGLFKDEIVPITAEVKDKDGNTQKVTVTQDEGIRPGVTAESLSKIRPAFKKDGSTHAGNASQVSDGAAVTLMVRRSVAEKLGLPIIGKFIDGLSVGVPPEIMGIGPAAAIPVLLKKHDLQPNDVDIYEINEAFASQALYSVRHVGIDESRVNPKGGAIAFGHPLGCTGTRQFATLFPELRRTGKKIGVTSMCIGTGMGAASLVVAE